MLPLLPHVAYVAWKKFGTLPGPLRYTISSISKKDKSQQEMYIFKIYNYLGYFIPSEFTLSFK